MVEFQTAGALAKYSTGVEEGQDYAPVSIWLYEWTIKKGSQDYLPTAQNWTQKKAEYPYIGHSAVKRLDYLYIKWSVLSS